MTKQEAFQQAKFIMLTAMVNHLRTDNVSNAIAQFGAQQFDFNSIDKIEDIEQRIDSLIKDLNCLKVNAEKAKQVIRDAE